MKSTDLNEFEVMLDNVPAFRVFRRCQTQWRVNFGSLLGLDYNIVFHVMDLLQIPPEQKLDCLDRISAIESGYIKAVSKK